MGSLGDAEFDGSGDAYEASGPRAGDEVVTQDGVTMAHGAELLKGDGAVLAVDGAVERFEGNVTRVAAARVARGEHQSPTGSGYLTGPDLGEVESAGRVQLGGARLQVDGELCSHLDGAPCRQIVPAHDGNATNARDALRDDVRACGPAALRTAQKHALEPMGCAPAMRFTGGVAVEPAAAWWAVIPHRSSTRRWLWFLAWVAVGAMVPMVVLGAFTIGIFFIPVAGVLTLILLSRRASWVGLPGLITGIGLPLLVVAYLNRSGPGNVCSTHPDGNGGCTQEWTPWPFLLVGLGLLIGGIIVFTRQRPEPPAAAWYPDPWQPGGLRWWDGRAWTGYTSTQPTAESPGQVPRT